MPRSSTDEFGQLLFGTARAWRTSLDQRLRPLGLSQGKWRTLIHLARAESKLTQKEIASRMEIEEPTLAGLLNRLQEDGWVKRCESPDDRRCKTVQLQRRSKGVLDKIFNTAHELRHELLSEIPQRDLTTCMRVLKEIAARADRARNNDRNGRSNGNGRRPR